MVKLIKNTNNSYTNISNQLVRDKRLSWKARGIFCYLWSQADNWQFYISEIANHAPEGKESLQNGIKELEKYGYLKRLDKHSKQNGKFEGKAWLLTDHTPELSVDGENGKKTAEMSALPSDGKTVQRVSRPTDNPSLRNNNNKNYQLEELSIERNKHSASDNALSVSALKESFELLWSDYPNKKGKKEAFNHYKAWRKASTNHKDEYLAKKLEEYLAYCSQNRWYHPMNGSTWFNGRFDDELMVTQPSYVPPKRTYD